MRNVLRLAMPLLAAAFLAGCGPGPGQDRPPIQIWPDMKQQPKYLPQRESGFFADRRTDRRPVPGTVARGAVMDLQRTQEIGMEQESYETGLLPGGKMYVGRNPLPLTMEVLEKGRLRFDVYCSPCHDRTGSGRGIVAMRSQGWIPTSIHDDRVRQMSDGEIFNIISYGRRSMPGYRHQVMVEDRWAVAAYVRALQRTRMGTIGDVPPELQGDLR